MSYFPRIKGALRSLLAQAGLSLLETAVGLVVVGMVVVPVLRMYQHDINKEAFNSTMGGLSTAVEGINQYFVAGNGAYPCPADMSLAEGDLGFGEATNCSNLASIQLCDNVAVWLANGGICKTSDGADAVIIGALPFATLKMSEENSLDYWNNKYIYAISHNQTNPASYVTNNGVIRVMDVRTGSPSLLGSTYDLFIFSTGESAVGGFNKRGTHLSGCGLDTARYEFENCDFDKVFFALEGLAAGDVKVSAYSRVSSSTAFFDDMTRAQQFMPVNTWYQHEDNPLYADLDFVLTQATKVGIGTTTPNSLHDGVTLMVVGDARADVTTSPDGGHLEADSICEESDSDCFDPVIITGAVGDMNCFSSSSYSDDPAITRGVKRIANSSVGCSSAVYYNTATTSIETIDGGERLRVDTSVINPLECPSGQLVKGINASGDLECVSTTTP